MVQSSEVLPPSTFQIPLDYEDNPEDYEIWSVRAPVKFDLAVMDGNTHHFDLDQETKRGKVQNSGVTTFELDGKMYSLSKAFATETESYRILSAAQDDEEEDEMDIEDTAGKTMKPLPVKFSRHFNLVETTNATMIDTDLAPSNERAPDLDMKALQMRIPYVPIDQKKGLKRRWNVMGSNATFKGYIDQVEDANSATMKTTTHPNEESAQTTSKTPASTSKSPKKRKKHKSEKKSKKSKK